MNQPVRLHDLGEVVQSVLIKGDLSKLTPQERVNYYNAVCKSVGLNPLTRPFDYIWLNGQLTLYARKDCADQLRKIYDISITLEEPTVKDNIFVIKANAKAPDGRTDSDYGAVFLPETIKGEIRANSILKGVTKAKRRVTLSICGLGFLDQTEIEDIPTSAKQDAAKFTKELPEGLDNA